MSVLHVYCDLLFQASVAQLFSRIVYGCVSVEVLPAEMLAATGITGHLFISDIMSLLFQAPAALLFSQIVCS